MSNEELVKLIQSNVNPADNLQRLYIQNERFIGMIARRYAHNKDDIDDLMQEAYFGLHEAVKRYEDMAGVLFMTYAGYWIRQAITNYLKNNGQSIRISSWAYEKITQYRKFVSSFQMMQGRCPSDTEICHYMGISQSTLDTIEQACQTDNIQSLDATIPGSDNENFTIGDTVQDKTVNVEDDVIDSMMENSRKTELWQIVKDSVNQQENEIINLRYKENLTLVAAGRECNISRERARVVESRALRKLRRAGVRRLLSEQFEINNAREYRGTITDFNNRFGSIVEDIAVKNVDIENVGMD